MCKLNLDDEQADLNLLTRLSQSEDSFDAFKHNHIVLALRDEEDEKVSSTDLDSDFFEVDDVNSLDNDVRLHSSHHFVKGVHILISNCAAGAN